MLPSTVQIGQEGIIALPTEFREQYGLNEGDAFSLVDLGDGAFLLTPQVSQVARLGDKIASLSAEASVSLDVLLEGLEEEREQYYRDHYGSP